MKHYMIHCPGWVYAGDFYGINRRAAIASCRDILGVGRMPSGFAIWEV